MDQRGHHGPADPAPLVGGMDVHLGHLERVGQPGLREVTAACRGQRAAHQVVPPLAVGAVEAIGEADDREPVTARLGPQSGRCVLWIVREGHGHAPERREFRVPFHDGLASRQLLLRRPHSGRIDAGQDAKFGKKACFAEFQQLRASSHPRKRTRARRPGRAPHPAGPGGWARRCAAAPRLGAAGATARPGGRGVLSDPLATFELRYN